MTTALYDCGGGVNGLGRASSAYIAASRVKQNRAASFKPLDGELPQPQLIPPSYLQASFSKLPL
jgi:hypothetical protein